MGRVAGTLLLLALLSFALPIAARADAIDITNQFGSVTITDAGISSFGSQLKSFNGIQAGAGHALGSVSFWTGAFIQSTGSIWNGGQFSSVGSGFVVTGVYGTKKGQKGTIFSGAFDGNIDWNLIVSNKFFHAYTLTGTVVGQLWNGHEAKGTVSETIYTYWNQEKIDHKGSIHLGTSTLNTTPEPGTLGLLGTGLLAMAGAIRRKIGKS